MSSTNGNHEAEKAKQNVELGRYVTPGPPVTVMIGVYPSAPMQHVALVIEHVHGRSTFLLDSETAVSVAKELQSNARKTQIALPPPKGGPILPGAN